MQYNKYPLLVVLVFALSMAGCGQGQNKAASQDNMLKAIEEKVSALDTEGAYLKSNKLTLDVVKTEPVPVQEEAVMQGIDDIIRETDGITEEMNTAEFTENIVTDTMEEAVGEIEEEAAVPRKPELSEGDMLIADFEGWPNNIGGEIGVYGSLEPDWDEVASTPYSWVYEQVTPGYSVRNVHSGKQSFRLVNGLGIKASLTWGSFAMDMGPTIDVTTMPKKVESLDTSKYKYLIFWAKGVKGGEKFKFIARDAHALDYMPQAEYQLPVLTSDWQKIVIPLGSIANRVDLGQIDNIGLAFGNDVGNSTGDAAFIDDFILTSSE